MFAIASKGKLVSSSIVSSKIIQKFKIFQASGPLRQLLRNQSTLVVAEHTGDNLLQNTRHAITAAKQLGGDISCLVAGPKCAGAAAEVAKIEGVTKVIVAENAAFEGNLPENLDPVVRAAQDQFKFTHIVGGASAFTRGLLPRVAAKLDVSPVSDVIGIKVMKKYCQTLCRNF